MKIGKGLGLHYATMEASRLRQISSFLENIPLTVGDCGGHDDNRLIVNKNQGNDFFFSLIPANGRVEYSGFENLGRKYKISFVRHGHEEGELTDQLFVGFKKDPYTGIFLRTGPIINPDASSQ